jgi:hypothetical protein
MEHGLPSNGHWVAYSPVTSETSSGSDAARPQALIPAVRRPCPRGTKNYPAPHQAFDCKTNFAANGGRGHLVGFRKGGPRVRFGAYKIRKKHGLTAESVGDAITNNRHGIYQPNRRRWLYGLKFEVAGQPIVRLEVYEQRRHSNQFNDGYALGVVTAYCPGYQGKCPPGTNASLP